MESFLEMINLKIKKYKMLRFFSILLASLFSLVGTISIIGLLMILNTLVGVGYFTCFVLTFVLSHVYSVIINEIVLKKLDNKMNNVLLKIHRMLEEGKTNIVELSKENVNDLGVRYDKLSTKSKLELLTYIKDGIKTGSEVMEESLICSLDSIKQEESFKPIHFKSNYSRKRKIEDEIKKQNYS